MQTAAAIAPVVGSAYTVGVRTLGLGVATVPGALALLVGFGLAWSLSGGLFSRHPIRDRFRKTVASPTALAIVIAFLVGDGLLIVWGVWAVLRGFGG